MFVNRILYFFYVQTVFLISQTIYAIFNVRMYNLNNTLIYKVGSVFIRRFYMDILNKVKAWAVALTEVGVSLLALGVVLEVLFKGQNIPFWPNINIIANIQSIVASFSAQGLVGLIAVWVLYHIITKK